MKVKEDDINTHIYKQIKKDQLDLSDEEQFDTCQAIDTALILIAHEAWMNATARNLLILEWQRRRTILPLILLGLLMSLRWEEIIIALRQDIILM